MTLRRLLSLFTALVAVGADAGYRPPPHPMRQLTNAVAAASGRRLLAADAALPAKYDLRDEDGKGTSYLSPIRDQLAYGTCWAHAAMAGIEYSMRKYEGLDADLSENNLANMHGFPAAFRDGGTHEMAMAVFLREDGPVAEALDPYVSVGTSVRERGVRIPRKVVLVPARSSVASAAQLRADLDVIKRAIMRYGPLATSYYHDSAYLRGAAYYCGVGCAANHAVSLVGWDDGYAASNFRSPPPGDGAFVIKNSWGPSMFDRGYTYVSYYDASLGFVPQVAYARLADGEDYGHVYQHDPYGYVSATGVGYTTAKAMNVFTARADERLGAFGFYALAENTEFSAWIVVNPSVSKRGVLRGTEHFVASGKMAEAGYEVHDFSQPVAVGAGTNFAIVVSIMTPRFTAPLAIMYNENFADGTPYVNGVEAVPGKSYVDVGTWSSSWLDISAAGEYFCCKVYAQPQAAERTTAGDTAVPHSWIDAYSAAHGDGDFLSTCFYGAYNALAEHVAANRLTVADSYVRGLDPDNAVETNLVATISLGADGAPRVGVSPKNEALWSYSAIGSTDLRSWHPQSAGDRFFKVRVEPR